MGTPRDGRLASRIALAVLATTLVAAALSACGGSHGSGATPSGVPSLDHVIVVVMENKSYNQARVPPYTANLIARGTSFSAYRAIGHPSQPNYLALWSGATQGVTSDTCPAPGSPFSVANLGQACEAAGLTWRAYCEDLPAAGSRACEADRALYTRKHAPWTNFSNLDHDNERQYPDLAADIRDDKLPKLAFVIPNACNNSHQCSTSEGDHWLSRHVPAMLAAVGPRGIVVLTWDEDDDNAGNHILTVIAGAPVKSGFVSSRPANHYVLLRTISDALGLTPFGAAKHLGPMTDIWETRADMPSLLVAPSDR
jgi:acid phosphatase